MDKQLNGSRVLIRYRTVSTCQQPRCKMDRFVFIRRKRSVFVSPDWFHQRFEKNHRMKLNQQPMMRKKENKRGSMPSDVVERKGDSALKIRTWSAVRCRWTSDSEEKWQMFKKKIKSLARLSICMNVLSVGHRATNRSLMVDVNHAHDDRD